MSDATVTVFAGPSTFGLPDELWPVASQWRPPAQRGDVAQLVQAQAPGVLVLCDGVFDATPAVSHAELCTALDAGWQVWGVASIGAIRAWELRDEGMHGFGQVFAMFGDHPDFTDDEMCLLHFPEAPYFPVTEALVNVRVALREHAAACQIDEAAAAHLVEALSSRWFGDRSETLIRHILVEQCGVQHGHVQHWLECLRGNRIKNRDLAGLLRGRPWLPAPTE